MMAAPVSRARLLPPERAAAGGAFRPRAATGPEHRAPASLGNRAAVAGARPFAAGLRLAGPPLSPGAGHGRLAVLAAAPAELWHGKCLSKCHLSASTACRGAVFMTSKRSFCPSLLGT